MVNKLALLLREFYTGFIHLFVSVCTLVLVLICALSCFGLHSRIAELCCHFMVACLYGAVILTGLVVFDAIAFKRRLRIAILNFVLLITVLGFVINRVEPLWSRVDIAPGSYNLTLLHANIWGRLNFDHETLFKQIAATKPDIILVSELTGKWSTLITDKLKDTYPYSFARPANGLGIYSKYPLETSDLRKIKYQSRARILARVKHPDVGSVTILVAHPVNPVGAPNNLAARNEEFLLYPQELSSTGDPAILVGDLNCTPWSPYFDKLIKVGNLKDSERGFGLQPSWPGVVVPPLLPIDHVLVSQSIEVKERRMLAPFGSDHLPLLVKLKVGTK